MSTEQFGDMRTEYSKSLVAVGEEDPNVVVLGADTTDSLKTANFGKKFPERFFNVGIAEANLVLCKQELPHADFDPDWALVNYNVIDGDVLILKEVLEK